MRNMARCNYKTGVKKYCTSRRWNKRYCIDTDPSLLFAAIVAALQYSKLQTNVEGDATPTADEPRRKGL